MQLKNFACLFLLVFLVLCLSWQVSLYWGALQTGEKYTSISLQGFDRKVQSTEESCFLLLVNSNFETEQYSNLLVLSNENVVLRKEIDVSKSPLLRECVPQKLLSKGENRIDIYLDAQRLFYHTTVQDFQKTEPKITLGDAGGEKISIKIENYDESKYAPVSIYVNGKLDHMLYFSGSNFSADEKLTAPLNEGQNNIRVEFLDRKEAIEVFESGGIFKMSPIIGLAIISILICVLAFIVFRKQNFFERAAFALTSFFAVFVAIFFLLQITHLLLAEIFVFLVLLAIIILIVAFRKNLKKQDALGNIDWRKKLWEISPVFITLICIVIFSSLLFNLFTPTYYGIWTSFYERQSKTITEQQIIPETDDFSFLGTKPFGYMSGYFYLNPGIAWVTGFDSQQTYAIIMLLSQAAFVVCAYLFFRSYGLGRKAYLGVAVCLMGGFVFSDFSFNIRHVISYSMLFLSIYFLREKKGMKAGLVLGIGTFFQTPLYLMYIALAPIIVTKKEMLKEFGKSLLCGAAIALILFAPTLISSGTPTQAESDVWGYLWSIPLYGFILDYLSVLLLIALFIVPFLIFKKTSFNSFSVRILIMLLIYLFIQLFISYRINVVATIAFALLIAFLFPKDFFKDRLSEYSLAAFFAIGYTFMFIVIMSYYPVLPAYSNAFAFAAHNTSTDAKFLNEPYLGHPFIFLAERKCTADLAVEYANEEMINDSFKFLKESDGSILKKYDVDYVINRSIFLDEKPVGNNYYKRAMEYEFLDKVYANHFLFLHWVDKERLRS